MTSLDIRFGMKNDAVKSVLQSVGAKLSPAERSTFLRVVVDPILTDQIRERFDSETSPQGNKWASLKPGTVEDRMWRGFGPGPIQQRHGALYNYVISSKVQGDTIVFPSPDVTLPNDAGKWGSRVWQALRAAQRGNTLFGKDIAPARRILGITVYDRNVILTALEEWVLAGV